MKEMKVRMLGLAVGLSLIGIILASIPALACEFSFNYERIEAPVGTEGEIGVRVEKTHNRCTMPDTLDYQFDWEHIQVLGETDWEETKTGVYEKWFLVSLSSPGEGFLKISRTYSKSNQRCYKRGSTRVCSQCVFCSYFLRKLLFELTHF